MSGRVLALTLLGAACEEDLPHECDEGTPTCDSSLIVLLPDPRTTFQVRIRNDAGFDATITCPSDDPDNILDEEPDYQFFCGQGRVTLATNLFFETPMFVTLEQGLDQQFDNPDIQYGSDFCGNTCTSMTLQLQ
jgi:hypothetical protein